MIVAGFGIRRMATLDGLLTLLGPRMIDALAVVADKADHPAIAALARARKVPLIRVNQPDLATDRAKTPSPRQPQRYGAKSVAEAAALAAAGPGSWLIEARVTAADGTATLAIAEGKGR